MKKLYDLNISTSNAPSGGKIVPFTVKGDVGAVFSLIVTNEDPKYYNFTDGVFQTVQTRLKNIEIPSSGAYSGLINIPSVSDDDQYDIRLFAEAHFDTYFDSVISKIPIITKTIYQYTDTTITFSVASKAYSGRYKTMPTVVEVEGFRGTSGNASINWTVEAQPAVAETYALKIVRQPISSDFEISSSTLPDSNMSLSKASLEIFDFTTTVNQPTWDGTQSATTSITVADPSGIRGDEESCTVSGIGFDNSTEQFVQTVNNATKVMTVNTAQQLIHGTILTFKGCANTAVIKAKIRIDKIPDSNLAVVLDLDNILTASTS